jgi:tetratricopeptide (TPR) repeat protein
VTAFNQTLEADPSDTTVLNQLGYAYAFSGNPDAAVATLRRYQTLRPSDANALDSTGDVYLIGGKLADAEKFYLQALDKDPNFQGGGDLFKAAMARLMSGDVAGADGLEKRLESLHAAAHDAALPVRQAEWAWTTGRRTEAVRQLAAFAQTVENGPMKEMASRAYSEVAVWQLMLGDRAAAADTLRKAIQFAGPSSAGSALLVRFLVQPAASAAEWKARADQLFRNPAQASVRDLMLAQALLLDGHFDAAQPLLQHLYDAGDSNGEGMPVLLAWADLETGKLDEAAALLRFNTVPPLGGPSLLEPLYFPRIYDLRARVAAKKGRPEEARAAVGLYKRLSGM